MCSGHGPGRADRSAGIQDPTGMMNTQVENTQVVHAGSAAQVILTMKKKADAESGTTSNLCIYGPSGKHQFDFSGLSPEEMVKAAAASVVAAGVPLVMPYTTVLSLAETTMRMMREGVGVEQHLSKDFQEKWHTLCHTDGLVSHPFRQLHELWMKNILSTNILSTKIAKSERLMFTREVFRFINEDLRRYTTSDNLNDPAWQPFADKQISIRWYSKEARLRLVTVQQAEQEAAQAAEELLAEENNEKVSKSASKKARHRANKQRKQLEQLQPVHEEEPDQFAKQAAQPPNSDADRAFLNLDDVGYALHDTAGYASTSVATALQCVVCMLHERNTACVPCGHVCVCEECGKQEVIGSSCPMCRANVSLYMRVFL